MSAVVPKQGDANSTQQTFHDFKSVFRKKSTTSFWRGKKKKKSIFGGTLAGWAILKPFQSSLPLTHTEEAPRSWGAPPPFLGESPEGHYLNVRIFRPTGHPMRRRR